MTRIALTGAAGNVGRELLGAFDGEEHVLVPFTHNEHDDIDSETLDVTDPDDVSAKLDDVDVVVHLAGASSPSADWDTAIRVNVHGTKYVFDAAIENGIDRVVFASSNHAVGAYNAPDLTDPERMTTDHARTVGPDAPTRPDSFYGVSKVACEGIANYYADRHGVQAVNVRIGWYMSEAELRDRAIEDAEGGKARFARAMWLSPRDCRDVLRKAAIADLPENPLTVNAVSRNDERFLSITETMRAVGYVPRDDAAEALRQ